MNINKKVSKFVNKFLKDSVGRTSNFSEYLCAQLGKYSERQLRNVADMNEFEISKKQLLKMMRDEISRQANIFIGRALYSSFRDILITRKLHRDFMFNNALAKIDAKKWGLICEQ